MFLGNCKDVAMISDSDSPCCYVLSLIFAILCGDNNLIDTTDKAMGRKAGK